MDSSLSLILLAGEGLFNPLGRTKEREGQMRKRGAFVLLNTVNHLYS